MVWRASRAPFADRADFALQVITPGVFLREGSGRVVAMWRLRLVQEWTGAIACILGRNAPEASALVSELAAKNQRADSFHCEMTDEAAVRPHIAQVCKRLNPHSHRAAFYHFIVFDDLWAAAHPDLANGVLRFAGRWDCL